MSKTGKRLRLSKEEVDEESIWLTENIYNGRFKGLVQLISPFDRYKDGI